MVEAGLIVARWLHLAAVTGLFGLALFPLYAPATALGGKAAARTFGALAGLALLSGLAWFYFTAASMAGSLAEAATTVPTVLTGTDFGPIWAARLALALLLCLPVMRSLPRIQAGLAALLLASLALTGHARLQEGLLGWVHGASDAAHLLAAGAWLGALAAFALLLVRAPDDIETARALAGFSKVGSIAVAVLLVSGVANGALILGAIAPLFATLYGRLLCAKVALFLLMVALAGLNRVRLVPALGVGRSGPVLVRLRWHVAGELGLGILVLAIVAAIGTLDPTAG